MSDWEQIEHEATQRLVGAMVGRYGARLSEETEEQARILAFVALAGVRSEYERLEEEVRRYNSSIVAHHNIANLSEEAIREGFGNPDGCPICREAQASAPRESDQWGERR